MNTEQTTCDICGELTVKENTWRKQCAAHWPTRDTIHGHTDEASAYVVDDYPYGFRARTQIRYWIEATKKGQRFVSQTLNPKSGKWNKPKKSTYSDVMVMTINDEGHVSNTGLHSWPSECELLRMESMLSEHITEAQKEAIRQMRIMNKASKYITYDVHTMQPGEKRQTDEEISRIWSSAIHAARNEA